MIPPIPPEPDPPEPSNIMIAKVKNSTNQTLAFLVRTSNDGGQMDTSSEQRAFIAYNEERTFTVPLGSNNNIIFRAMSQSNSYPDITDSHYDWSNANNVSWKINNSSTAVILIPSANGYLFSGVYDATQNYATQV